MLPRIAAMVGSSMPQAHMELIYPSHHHHLQMSQRNHHRRGIMEMEEEKTTQASYRTERIIMFL